VAGVASGPAPVLDICLLPGHMPPVTNPRRGRRTQGRLCEGANVGVCQSAAAAVVVGGVFVVMEQLRSRLRLHAVAQAWEPAAQG